MSRKTAAAHGAPANDHSTPRLVASSATGVAIATSVPADAPSAPIVERKRARRARVAAPPPPPPVVVKPAVDLTRSDARKALAVAFPTAITGKVVEATEADTRAATAYLDARDAEARAQGAKEAAGNALRYAIGDAEEIHGEGWKATWKFQKSEIDWGKLVSELAIESEVIERYRKPSARVLLVRETADT